MNFKNTELSQKSILFIIFSALLIIGSLTYWFAGNLGNKASSNPDGMPKPTLPPPQLTPEEKARIQASINASSTKPVLSEKEMIQALNSLTAPKK